MSTTHLARRFALAAGCLATATALAAVTFDGTLHFGTNEEWSAPKASTLQTNYTGFGDQRLTAGSFPGSELDELYVRTDGTYLYVGITGNLEQNGNAIVLLVDTDLASGVGQNVLQTEISPASNEVSCPSNSPPSAVQGLGAELTTDDKGNVDPSDDETKRVVGSVGTTLDGGFEPDHAIAVDTSGGSVYVTQYSLYASARPGTWDDPGTPPGGLGQCNQAFQESLAYYATRLYRGSGTVNSGNGDLTGGTNPANGWRVAFNNTGKLGVTGTQVAAPSSGSPGDPRSQTTGLEARIPHADLGLAGGNINVKIAVLLTSSSGLVSNQVLPGIGGGTSTTNPGLRPNFTAITSGGVGGNGQQYASVSRTAGAFGATINGQNIVGDFGAGNLVASQDTVTGFGDRSCLTVSSGSELDELFVKLGEYDSNTQNQFIYVGVSGNLATDGNAVVLLLDTDVTSGTGQNTLKTEIAPASGTCPGIGPPFAVPNLGQALTTDVKGDQDPSNDETMRDSQSTGTILDNTSGGAPVAFEPDHAVAIDAFGGSLSVTQYDLFASSQGTWDDPGTPPGGSGDCTAAFQETLPYYAARVFRGSVGQNSGSGTLSTGTNPNGSQYAFDNTGLQGVTATQVATAGSGSPGDPRTQSKGLEAKISLLDLGITLPVTDPLSVRVSVILIGGGGLVSNQTLPPINATPTVSTAHLNFRPDFNAVAGNQFASVSVSPATGFAPVIDGANIVTDFGLPPVASQTTTTSFLDTTLVPVPDCDQVLVKGTELDQLFVQQGETLDTQADSLELGISGNLQDNGNNVVIFLDTIAEAGQTLLANNVGRLAGNNGDTIPCAADYALLLNIYAGGVYLDLHNLNDPNAQTRMQYIGMDPAVGGDGILDNNGPVSDWRVILNNGNLMGVTGSSAPDPQTAAGTAGMGFELSIPLSAIGAPANGTQIGVFVMVTGNGDDRYLSNQFLPSLAGGGQGNFGTGNPAGSRTNLANAGYTCLAATLGPAIVCHDPRFDSDGDGDVDQKDFGAFQRCFTGSNLGPVASGCECYDWNLTTGEGDGDIDAEDLGFFQLCATRDKVSAIITCDNPPPP